MAAEATALRMTSTKLQANASLGKRRLTNDPKVLDLQALMPNHGWRQHRNQKSMLLLSIMHKPN